MIRLGVLTYLQLNILIFIMKMNNWTIGKGIGIGLIALAIMGIVIAVLGFAKDIYFERYYCEKSGIPIPFDRPILEKEVYTKCIENNVTTFKLYPESCKNEV